MQSYTVAGVWESPARQLSYQGKDAIGRNYHTMASSLSDLGIYPIDRFATADRVTDDTIVKFTLTGNEFKNAPVLSSASRTDGLQVLSVDGATLVALQRRLHDTMALICIAFGNCRAASVVWCCRAEARLHCPAVFISR